jgi:site-specific recombinase XerD
VATALLRRSVKRYAKKASIKEIERVSPHTLRHTFATRLYLETGKIRIVQKALGHSDLSPTMIYTHIVDEELEGAMKEL